MDSDLAWVNGKSGRQSWRYADAFQRSIISEAIYYLFLVITTSRSLRIWDESETWKWDDLHILERRRRSLQQYPVIFTKHQT